MRLIQPRTAFSRPLWQWLLPITLIVCCLIYSKIPDLQFQSAWDDQWVVKNWYTETGFTWDNLGNIFIEYYHGQYSPLNQIYYNALYESFGYNSAAFHLAGLILHLLNVALVFLFLLKFLKFAKWGRREDDIKISAGATLLFAVHPLMVESVAWLSASKVLLAGVFFLGAAIFYVEFLTTKKLKYWVGTLLFFILSFLAKEQSLTLSLTILLIGFINHKGPLRLSDFYDKIPFLFLAIIFGLITMQSQAASGQGSLAGAESYPLYQRFLFGSYAFIEYLVKCIFPIKLLYLYIFPVPIGHPMPFRFWIYPIIILVVILTMHGAFKQRWLIFGILFFLLNLSVVLHVLPISRLAIVADRYVYLPSIGIFFCLSFCFTSWINQNKRWSIYIGAAGLLYVFYLMTYTYQRIPAWTNSITLKKEIRELIETNQEKYK